MAINLSDNLQVNFPKHIDARLYDNQTPYSSSAQVTGSIISSYRYKGLTVFVSSSTEVAEYWFRDGIANGDLILKSSGETTFPYSGSAVITGSLLISGSGLTVSGTLNITDGITGSLYGTASWADSASQALTASYITGSVFDSNNLALSASYAISSSQATSASYAISSSQATSASYAISSSQATSASYAISASYVEGVFSYNFTAPFSNQTTWTINHNLGYRYVIIQTFDTSGYQIIPSEINLVNDNQAIITFSEQTSGTAVVTLGGASFLNSQLPASPGYSVQYNDGGGSWGGSSKFQFDGTTVAIFDPTEIRYAFLTEAPLFNTSNVTQKTLLDDNYVEEFTTTTTGVQFTGNILAGKIFDVQNVTAYDIAFLSGSDNAWYPVTGNVASLDSRLLGVILSDGDILTEGYITVAAEASSATDAPLIHGTLEPGSPVYIGVGTPNTQPYLSTTRPNSTGNIVRIIGHLIYQNITTDSNYWLMYFRPDHTWVEIA